MRTSLLLFIGLILSAVSLAQSRIVSGSVVDTTGTLLADVSVNLKSSSESLSTKTNAAGKFQFTNVAFTGPLGMM